MENQKTFLQRNTSLLLCLWSHFQWQQCAQLRKHKNSSYFLCWKLKRCKSLELETGMLWIFQFYSKSGWKQEQENAASWTLCKIHHKQHSKAKEKEKLARRNPLGSFLWRPRMPLHYQTLCGSFCSLEEWSNTIMSIAIEMCWIMHAELINSRGALIEWCVVFAAAPSGEFHPCV